MSLVPAFDLLDDLLRMQIDTYDPACNWATFGTEPPFDRRVQDLTLCIKREVVWTLCRTDIDYVRDASFGLVRVAVDDADGMAEVAVGCVPAMGVGMAGIEEVRAGIEAQLVGLSCELRELIDHGASGEGVEGQCFAALTHDREVVDIVGSHCKCFKMDLLLRRVKMLVRRIAFYIYILCATDYCCCLLFV